LDLDGWSVEHPDELHGGDIAQQALGLNSNQAVELFNTNEDLAILVLELIAAGKFWPLDKSINGFLDENLV